MATTCSNGCKNLVTAISKIESCCSNSGILKNFDIVDFYFTFDREVEQYCNLPITSLCLSEGKIYLGISPDILIFSVISSVIVTSIILLLLYVCCCRRNMIPFIDSHEYSQLNVDEEELVYSKEYDGTKQGNNNKNTIGYDNETNSLIYDFNNNNQNMAEFVNKTDLNIRGIIN